MQGVSENYHQSIHNEALCRAADLGLGIISSNEDWYKWVTNYIRMYILKHMEPNKFRQYVDEYIELENQQKEIERRVLNR